MTKDAAPEIAELHHRMPVILPADQIKDWLRCETGDIGWVDGFKHRPVKAFGIKEEGIELIEPIV